MPSFTAAENAMMARALRLARRGVYSAHPNPMVGCVLVHDNEIVGEGWHVRAGERHAEINALRHAGHRARGATAFVTLEPCAHQGKTPPCANALVDAGVARVVVAVEDPFAEVAGNGLRKLREAGIDVDVGLMAAAAGALNRGFFSRVQRSRPFVTLKLACSLDGGIAMQSGESQWITGSAAREDVHRMRARSDAVMTGIGTVLADDPSLTARTAVKPADEDQPLRVVIDSRCRMPADAAMLGLPGRTLLCCCLPEGQADTVTNREELHYTAVDDRVPLQAVLRDLGARNINNLLVESGPTLAGALLDQGLVDELVIYQSPDLLGSETKRLLKTPKWSRLTDRMTLEYSDVRRFGRDLRITLRPQSEN